MNAYKYKKSRLGFYLHGLADYLSPRFLIGRRKKHLLALITDDNREYIQSRINYCIALQDTFQVSNQSVQMSDLSAGSQSIYYFDMLKVAKYFPGVRFDHLFGDIVDVPAIPTLLKSRPLAENNQNSILLKLNSARHYNFLNDDLAYEDKNDSIVWRGRTGSYHHRAEVCRQYFDHPKCDIAVSDAFWDNGDTQYTKPPLTIAQQLQSKFVLSLEGKDVATNLKWIMSSNSVCFMRKPRYETWFMEGTLIPNYHYVELKDDFSDLLEKVDYCIAHPNFAKEIVKNANNYVEQFLDEDREELISMLVMQKYLSLSGQY